MLTSALLCLLILGRARASEEKVCLPVDRTLVDDLEARISGLERRLRAVEQPVWQISGASGNWDMCAEGPCKCRPETRSLSCWSLGLDDLPPSQLVPKDVLKLQVARGIA